MQLLSRNEPHETRKYKRTKRLYSPRLEKVQTQHGTEVFGRGMILPLIATCLLIDNTTLLIFVAKKSNIMQQIYI